MSGASKDHYATLGVPADASSADIKRAYRSLARRLHPDLNPDPEAGELFAAASEAHAILADPDRRAAYDRALRAHALPQHSAPAASSFSRAGTGPLRRGTDLNAEATITFTDAAVGTQCQLVLRYPSPCESCSGTGHDPAGARRTCPGCDGLGMHPVTSDPCPVCATVGSVTDVLCPQCQGSGSHLAQTRKTVKLPAGLRDGQRIRLARQGGVGTGGGAPGDLYVTVRIAPHPVFQPAPGHPHDVGLILPVRYTELVLGAQIPVPTVTGEVATLTLPPNARPNTMHVMDGLGLPNGTGRGAMRVWVTLAFPDASPTGVEREALKTLAEAEQRGHWDPRDGMFAAVSPRSS